MSAFPLQMHLVPMKYLTRHSYALLSVLLLPLTVACTSGGGGSDSSTNSGQTEESRRLGIVIPGSMEADISVSEGPLTVTGEVLDLDGKGLPGSLRWMVESTGGAQTEGTTPIDPGGTFSAEVPLEPGDNLIRLSIANSDAQASFQATLNPGYAFTGQLQVTPDVVYLDEPREITAAIALLDPETDSSMVELVRVDDGVETVIANLTDDGNLFNGDEIMGDGIYTGRFWLTESEPGLVRVRTRVQLLTSMDEAHSEPFDILASKHLTEEEVDEILTLQTDLQLRLDTAAADSDEDLEDEVDAIISELELLPEVAQVGESDSGRGVYILYESGVAGALYSPLGDDRSASPAQQRMPRYGAPQAGQGRVVEAPPYSHYYKRDAVGVTPDEVYQPAATSLVQNQLLMASGGGNKVGSNRALGIGAQRWDWGSTEADQALAVLESQGCYETTLIEYGAAGAGNVEDFKNLGAYGVIVIATHGDSFYNGIMSFWNDVLGWNWPLFGGLCVLDTNMAITPANMVTYEDDLRKGRLVVYHGNRYGIAPRFIDRYCGSLPNSLVWMGTCRGAWNGTLAGAFLGRGAGAYLSFDDYVSVTWPIDLCVEMIETMVEPGNTLDDAFTAGQLDPFGGADPAELRLYGALNLAIDLEGIQDGDFESNSIGQSWNVSGDGRIIPSLGASLPTSGSYMGIVSTGLGFTTDSGTISQSFCMPMEATSISFDWNFFSEEFLEYVGSQFQDSFIVTLTDVDDPTVSVELLNVYVDSLASIVSPVANSFDQGDVYATGWQSTSASIPEALRGRHTRLSFRATDVGDSIYDTAVLIDQVEIATGTP